MHTLPEHVQAAAAAAALAASRGGAKKDASFIMPVSRSSVTSTGLAHTLVIITFLVLYLVAAREGVSDLDLDVLPWIHAYFVYSLRSAWLVFK